MSFILIRHFTSSYVLFIISGEDEANIVQNDRNFFQHQSGATPVESSYHGSNETAETSR